VRRELFIGDSERKVVV